MALEPGGYADKLGNRYEGRWVVKQLLRVLNEQLVSITVEAVGDDEAGVDLWVEDVSGRHFAQQCKLRNGSSNQWSIADLSRVGVLGYLRQQLNRNNEIAFSLVTATPSTLLHDICNSARDSSGDPESFYLHQIVGISKDRKKAFINFCNYLSLNPEIPNDRAIAYNYLQRTFIELWPDTLSNQADLRADAQWLVNGDPDSVIANLSDYAETHLRKTISSEDIWHFLTRNGFSPRKLPNDNRILPRVIALRQQFDESVSSHLIAGDLIPRNETKVVLDALEREGVVVLHGRPGFGKSSVLYEITQHYENNGQIYLPLRLDRQEPRNTTQQFGHDLGLPESPVKCLDAISNKKSCTLVLDQLDAIRWSYAHSKNALQVCKSLVREVMRLRELGGSVSIIIACRTYDLENDPEIKVWLSQTTELSKRMTKVEVGPLSKEVVSSIANKVGVDSLSERQISILNSPQHMAMWVRLVEGNRHIEFQNRVQLMREYWSFKIQELVKSGLSVEAVDSEISRVVKYMESKGRISAPYSINKNVHAINELCACGILQVASNQITFSHQSYLDYQIASNLLREIFSGSKDICEWLGDKNNQTLFHREQLRQVLSLLSEESPDEFFLEVKKIIVSDKIRFNLKHLTLEVIGLVEVPDEKIIKYMLKLANDESWKAHIIGVVFLGHPIYINWLIDSHKFKHWLSDDEWRENALWLLRSVTHMIPDQVTDQLLPYIDDEEWRDRILGCLNWNIHDDSEKMFQMRVQLARYGISRNFVEWKKLSAERCIRLLEAVLQSYEPDNFTHDSYSYHSGKSSRLENWSADDMEVLLNAARERAHDVWDIIVPQLIRLATDKNDTYHSKDLWLDSDDEELRYGREKLPNGILKLCIAAGKELTEKESTNFWVITEPLRQNDLYVIRYALVSIYASLVSELANEALNWLMSDIPNFIVGTGYEEPKWMPVVRLIEALTPYCSEELFQVLENKIIQHKDENLMNDAEYWISSSKRGHFGAYWGRAQYFLLPTLFEERRSKKANELIDVLNRKFEGYEKDDFVGGMRSRGGVVSSTIPGDRVNKISDRSWLNIIANKNVPDDGDFNWRKGRGVRESSVRYFSSDLELIAKRHPSRFAKLALKFPDDTPPQYKSAILEALKVSKPDNIAADELAEWKPANHELVLLVLNKFNNENSDSFPSRFCWLLINRSDENWPEHVIKKLIAYALSHKDPEPKKLNIGNAGSNFDSDESKIRNLESNAINCVRGVAAMAIGQLLWSHPKLLDKLKFTLERIVEDEHPAVRIASLQAILPVVNIDEDYAVHLFTKAIHADPRVAASRHAIHFYNACMKNNLEQFTPIIIRMLESSLDEVVEYGAQEVAARWLFHDYFANEIDACIAGNESQRKGVANIAAHFIGDASHFKKCKILVDKLKNDESKDVRKKLSSLIYKDELFTSSQSIEFLVNFTDSLAFADDTTSLLYKLDKYSGDLLPFAKLLIAIGEHFIKSKASDEGSEVLVDLHSYMPLMVRLYEQAKDIGEHDIEGMCLDIWDGMFEKRVGSVHEISKVID